MWELDYKESWVPKNWCFWTVVLEKTLENPLDSKETKSVNPKGNQSWIFTGRTDAEAETPILGHLMRRADSFEKTLMLERLKVGEGDDGGWHVWMASLTQWTRVWVNSRSWEWTGNPGVLQSTGWQIVGHDWMAEVNWADINIYIHVIMNFILPNFILSWLLFYMLWHKGDKDKILIPRTGIPDMSWPGNNLTVTFRLFLWLSMYSLMFFSC